MMNKNRPLFWIIDEEWSDYKLEEQIIYDEFPTAEIKYSSYNYVNDLKSFGKNASVIIAQVYADLPKKTISNLNKCRGIALFGGGYDRVDIVEAAKKEIPVTNVKKYCKEDIAEYVINAILFSAKPLNEFSKSIFSGKWGFPSISELPHRIDKQILLIIGYGRIGSYVAEKALNMGIKVVAYDPKIEPDNRNSIGVDFVSLKEGLQIADFVSIHCNLVKETEHLISKTEFCLMKKNCILINTARGKIVNEQNLIEAVKSKKIRGAILDVIANEPPLGQSTPILEEKNIIVTPHISYLSVESIAELKRRATKNAIDMYNGKIPDDVVN
jgi:phosphoglycerate dehydrogenase-like enzyme